MKLVNFLIGCGGAGVNSGCRCALRCCKNAISKGYIGSSNWPLNSQDAKFCIGSVKERCWSGPNFPDEMLRRKTHFLERPVLLTSSSPGTRLPARTRAIDWLGRCAYFFHTNGDPQLWSRRGPHQHLQAARHCLSVKAGRIPSRAALQTKNRT